MDPRIARIEEAILKMPKAERLRKAKELRRQSLGENVSLENAARLCRLANAMEDL
jgi:hypothetical protein